MPTEHEFKYLIDKSIANEFDRQQLAYLSRTNRTIEQGYIDFGESFSNRVRCSNSTDWVFTFKKNVGDRVVEIETTLDEKDAQSLWSICKNKLKKTRYCIENNGVTWELDLFYNDDGLYLVMAEVEMPEGGQRPSSVPTFLNKYILYEVPLTDLRFSNTKLSDIEHVNRIYSSFKQNTI